MSYNADMANTKKAKQIGVRFEMATIKDLEKEAAAKGLDLAPYVRHLVFTHQDRQKNKKS